MRRWRSAAASLALGIASTALALLAIELAVRATQAAGRGGKEDRARLAYVVSDPVLGWRKQPGSRGAYRRREYETEIRINSLGMRDPERTARPRAGVARVLALGDSFVEAYTVAEEATVTRQLETRLRSRRGCAVEVLNGGTSGWSTDQEFLYYRDEAADLGARVVLLFLYYNDVLANVQQDYWGAAKPMLRLDAGRLEIAPRPTPKPGAGQRRAARAVERDETGPGSRPWYRSALAALVRERLARGRPLLYQRLASWGLVPPLEPEAPPTELSIYERKPPPLMQFAWMHTLLILEALREQVEARGGRLVVVYVPAPFEVDDRAWELTRLRYGLDEARWDRRAVARRLVGASRRRGLEVLDLNPALRAAQLRGATYFTYDNHWNARGHAAAADAVAERLAESGHVSCP